MDRQAYEKAVDSLYEAALRPELWKPALGQLADASQSFGVQMLRHHPEGAALHAASDRLDPVLKAFFAEKWHVRNPRETRARLRVIPTTEVVTDAELFTDEELDKEAWQTEFLDRYGLRWFLSLFLVGGWESAPLIMTFERLKSAPRFAPDEIGIIRESVAHIQRAARVSQSVGAAAQQGMLDALDAVHKAAILLDERGRVARCNAAAERLLGDGLVISQGVLRATAANSTRPLERLIANICWPGAASSQPSVDSVAVRRQAGPPLVIQGAPLVNTARDLFQRARALLLVTPLHTLPEIGEAILIQAFGFTHAEVRVAREMARGAGLPATAALLGVSPSTVRSHLKAVFNKTNTHSQSELAVMLSRVGSGYGG